MKQFKITILFVMLMSMIGTKSYAYDIVVRNADGVYIYYNYINDGKELEVTHYGNYRGSDLFVMVIPGEVNYMNRNLKVTRIGDEAFRCCDRILSITIPNSVTSIGYEAFYYCTSLTSVTIGNGVTSIGELAFEGCENLTSITIPNSVTSIGVSTFKSCRSLTSVTIPNSVTSIGKSAFYGCRSLTSVTIPNSVTSIGYKAFAYCHGLTSVTIPNSVTSIGGEAFSECKGLTSVTIGNGVTSIGASTFKSCRSLTSVTIPNSVTSIGKLAFMSCERLTSITIPNSVTSIDYEAFAYCHGLTSVTIGNGVTSIGYGAFEDSNILTIYSLIENPFSIDSSSFSKDTYFNATLYVPVGTIDKYKSTGGWKNFVFIEEWTGGNNEEPSETPDNPDDVSTTSGSCGETANYSYDKATHTLAISGKGEIYDYDNGSNKAPWSAYADEIQKIEIEPGIISVGYFAFYKCSCLTSLSVPATLKYIGRSAFEDCTSLTTLSLNEGLLILESSAFKNCKGITDVYCYAVTVPNTDENAFDGTPTEKSTLHVPANSVDAYRTSRPWSDFKTIVATGSSELEGISAYSSGGAVMQTNDLINSGSKLNWTFSNNSNVNVTLVSMQLIDGVTKVEGNLMSVNKLVEAGGSVSYTTNIGALGIHVPVTCRYRYNYDGNEYFTDAVYTGSFGPDPNPTTDSGTCGETVNYSYDKATHTLSISGKGELYDYDNGSNKAPWSAYADEIQNIKIESGIISVGYFAFYKCSCLTSLSVPATLKYIGRSAFEDCTSLTTLSLNGGLLILESSAFKNCKGITDVYCYAESVPMTDKTAFDGTPIESATLHVPANSVEAYRTSWPWSDFKEVVPIDAVGIMGVKQADDRNGEYYDLTGRRVHQLQKGLYIRNSKKVIVK